MTMACVATLLNRRAQEGRPPGFPLSTTPFRLQTSVELRDSVVRFLTVTMACVASLLYRMAPCNILHG